jgi:hypothetical protein
MNWRCREILNGTTLAWESEVKLMGERTRFKEGDKSPKNAVYMEIGESGASVQDPMIIELSKGEKFPAPRNKNRVWTQK